MFLLKLSPPSEAGLDGSIQNYTGHLRSCLLTKDLWEGLYGSAKGKLGMLAPQATEKDSLLA